VTLARENLQLAEKLTENVHAVWAQRKIGELSAIGKLFIFNFYVVVAVVVQALVHLSMFIQQMFKFLSEALVPLQDVVLRTKAFESIT
jgi:cell division protein FtsL